MRPIFLALLMTGCAVAPTAPPPDASPAPPPVPPPTGLMPPPSTPPPPVPPPPPDAAAFLSGPEPALSPTGDPRVDAYRERVLQEGGTGWRPYLLRLFAGVEANPEILAANDALDPPDTPAEYVRRYVTPERIATGRRLLAQLRADPPPSPYGVPLEVQLALWGVLADYGASPPPFDMIQTYLMLGAYGRGANFPSFDIYRAAQIVIEGRVERAKARAYANGRIGQVQWLPDQYLDWGRDGDGDGKIDIWASRADIFANLGPREWEAGTPMIVEVGRPDLDPNDPMEARILRSLETSTIGAYMLPRPGGGAWPPESRTWSGRFVEPFGPDGPAYLLTRNFTPVNYGNPFKPRYWNEDEDPGFGIAVALLADAIAGRPGPSLPIR